MVKSLQIISTDNLDRTMEVLIDGKYVVVYWFHGEVPISTVRKIMKHSAGRTIQYLKKNSYKVTQDEEKRSNTPQIPQAKDPPVQGKGKTRRVAGRIS